MIFYRDELRLTLLKNICTKYIVRSKLYPHHCHSHATLNCIMFVIQL